MNVADYLSLLQASLPQGLAWPRSPTALLTKMLNAIATEFARVDARALNLMDEQDPRTTLELLPDHEAFAGLPDPCVTTEQTIEQRRNALKSKLRMRGGQSPTYFIAAAEDMGYVGATIEHQYHIMHCNDECDYLLHSASDVHTWTLNLPSDGAYFVMTTNSTCDDSLAAWGDEAIECRVNRYKPAHTNIIFTYGA